MATTAQPTSTDKHTNAQSSYSAYAQELEANIQKTRESRFNAYERLRKTQRLSTYTTSLLSAYLIIINLLSPFDLLPAHIDPAFVSFASVALSIMLLVFVIMESARDYSLRGKAFHDCSLELGALRYKLHALLCEANPSHQRIDEMADAYHQIMVKYDNHKPIDYELYRAHHPEISGLSATQRLWLKFYAAYGIHTTYFVFIAGPPLLISGWFLS